jgi:hypothetical protein
VCWWVALKLGFIYNESRIEIPFNKWPNNTKQVWGLKHIWWASWQMHIRWRLWCRRFLGQFNEDVICESDPWHVWAKSKATNNCSTHHAQIDEASIQLDCTWQMLLKVAMDSL